MKLLKHLILFCFLHLLFVNANAQKRNLDRAKKAIYQYEYGEAVEELNEFLIKNEGKENNVYFLLASRVYGDPQSPLYDVDTAYKIISKVIYYPSTFDPKMDIVICKNYQVCLDTVKRRKTAYVRVMMQNSIASKNPKALKGFILKYNQHPDEVEEATKALHKMEFDYASKKDKILLYNLFVENYPKAEQVGDAKAAIEKLRYERARRINKVKAYESFLKEYPTTQYRAAVDEHIHDVRWQYCVDGNDISRYREYLKHYPNSEHASAVYHEIEEIQWNQVRELDEIPYYIWFKRTYPASVHVDLSNERIFVLSWHSAKLFNDVETYEDFISSYPNTPESIEAREALELLRSQEKEEIDAETD